MTTLEQIIQQAQEGMIVIDGNLRQMILERVNVDAPPLGRRLPEELLSQDMIEAALAGAYDRVLGQFNMQLDTLDWFHVPIHIGGAILAAASLIAWEALLEGVPCEHMKQRMELEQAKFYHLFKGNASNVDLIQEEIIRLVAEYPCAQPRGEEPLTDADS